MACVLYEASLLVGGKHGNGQGHALCRSVACPSVSA